MSINVTQKKRGRPATGQMSHVTVRLPDDLLPALERFAQTYEPPLSRSDSIRAVIGFYLAEKGFLK